MPYIHSRLPKVRSSYSIARIAYSSAPPHHSRRTEGGGGTTWRPEQKEMMRTPPHTLYTNDVTAEYLANVDRRVFTEAQLATFSAESLALVREQERWRLEHPPIGIYRVAAQGSESRLGGVIENATLDLEFKLSDNQLVRAAQVDDCVVYPDGTQSHIITGAGEANSHLALVGSRLSNGDEIINTPQSHLILVARAGVAWNEDFLPDAGA